MKTLGISIIICLVLSLLWQRTQINTMSKELQFQRDSLEIYHLQRLNIGDRYEMLDKFYQKIREPQRLELYNNDTILEAHRIMEFGNKSRLLKIEVLKDSAIKLTFKTISIRNPLTGHGVDSLYKSQVQMLDRDTWNKFKESFNKISVYDITFWNGMLDCFGGDLSWEATIKHRTYRFSTHCRQAPEFTDACELLLRQVKDKELQERFKEQDKRRAEALKY